MSSGLHVCISIAPLAFYLIIGLFVPLHGIPKLFVGSWNVRALCYHVRKDAKAQALYVRRMLCMFVRHMSMSN